LEKELKDVQQRVNEKIGMNSVDKHFLVANATQVSRYRAIISRSACDITVDTSDRNQIPVWHHRIYGISLPINRGCRRSSRYRLPDALR